MTKILQVSWDLDGKHELHQMRIERTLKVFGLEPGSSGAGFGRRDMEFEYTLNLTESEERLMRLDLDSLKGFQGLPNFEWVELYDDADDDDDLDDGPDDPFMGTEGD